MDLSIQQLASRYEQMMSENRRFLHSHPEPSFQEIKTQEFIVAKLREWGVAYRKTSRYYSTVARIKGDRTGKTVAFRADIDALCMQEENDTPYRSQTDGVMHACGHDAHTAVLLALVKLFAENRELIAGEVVFIFQHAEEVGPGGAVTVIEEGFLEGIDAIFCTHIWTDLDIGHIGVRSGPVLASVDVFNIMLRGLGGHGAQPHHTRDALLAAASLTLELQSIVSRNVDPISPAVLSVCRLEAGSGDNIIPEQAVLAGTIRCFDEETRKLIRTRIGEVCSGVCTAHGVNCEYEFTPQYPAVVNNAAMAGILNRGVRAFTETVVDEYAPSMVGEDFAYYAQKVPAVFFFTGARNAENGIVHKHHSPRFDIDERSMTVALECLLAAYMEYIG